FLGGQLPDPEMSGVAEHLSGCERCLQSLSAIHVQDGLLDMVHALKSSCTVGEPRPEVEALVWRVCGLLAEDAAAAQGSTRPGQEPPSIRATTAQVPAPAGFSIPGYELLSPLGQGGMGAVFKARQTRLGKLMAVKLLSTGGPISASA